MTAPKNNPPDCKSEAHDAFARNMAEVAARSQTLMQDFVERQMEKLSHHQIDPLNLSSAFLKMTEQLMADPHKLIDAQFSLWKNYLALWNATTQKMLGGEASSVVAPEKEDKRFRDKAWEENAIFDYIKQSYLLSSKYLQGIVSDVEGLDKQTQKKLAFYTRQFVDAMAPTNFAATNPAVLRETIETKGENLLKGLQNLLDDLERGEGQLDISMTDRTAFEVGKNIAITPGQVIYENDLMQLIQYAPGTKTVHDVPILIIPPWINKYYILDLRPDNSMVKYLVDQGHTVFVISWVNPDEKLAQKTYADYMFEGPLAAMDAIEKSIGAKRFNMIGYCLGGTLLATLAAYMAQKKDPRIQSCSYMAAMLDFEEAGDLSVFIDEEMLAALEKTMAEKGYLEGHHMATTFNMLRANDLIWSFVINNYLLGKEPFPFDLLYWNSDSTRMPAAMHSFYLRKMYQQNKLAQPGGISIKNVKIDLGTAKQPSFILATREDHIAPWQSVFKATHLLGGKTRFCLAASGHIAGVVNPPTAKKYAHWLNDKKARDGESWLEAATEKAGSWWPKWLKWLAPHAGEQVPARDPQKGKLKPIEPAPGRYVKVKSRQDKGSAES